MEVSPRDGLQNESEILPTELKVKLIEELVDLNLKSIEVGSFVSPKWVRHLFLKITWFG
jgi:hydroxymethylglutaryl-CoA lyase